MHTPRIYRGLYLACLVSVNVNSVYGMGLRTFVALPVEKTRTVMRLSMEYNQYTDTNTLSTSAAYGITAKQTLLLGIPYRLSPAGVDRQGDVSALYRHNVWKEDRTSGTSRFSLLAGTIIPTGNNRDLAAQAGFVFTRFNNRYEIDFDVLYQKSIDNRPDSGRYDISWQYRLSPTEYPEWGIVNELYSVLELNGRWNEGDNATYQVTAGLQWIHKKVVIEGGVVKDMNKDNAYRYIVSTRFYF